MTRKRKTDARKKRKLKELENQQLLTKTKLDNKTGGLPSNDVDTRYFTDWKKK